MINVFVVGYGTIGQRLADGVSLQEDMNLIGVADAAMSLGIRALKEKGMPYDLYAVSEETREAFEKKTEFQSAGFWKKRCRKQILCWTQHLPEWELGIKNCIKSME